jgi:hypothetical protein
MEILEWLVESEEIWDFIYLCDGRLFLFEFGVLFFNNVKVGL